MSLDGTMATLEFGGQFVPLLQAWTSGTAMKTITITTQNKHFPRQSEHKGIYIEGIYIVGKEIYIVGENEEFLRVGQNRTSIRVVKFQKIKF